MNRFSQPVARTNLNVSVPLPLEALAAAAAQVQQQRNALVEAFGAVEAQALALRPALPGDAEGIRGLTGHIADYVERFDNESILGREAEIRRDARNMMRQAAQVQQRQDAYREQVENLYQTPGLDYNVYRQNIERQFPALQWDAEQGTFAPGSFAAAPINREWVGMPDLNAVVDDVRNIRPENLIGAFQNAGNMMIERARIERWSPDRVGQAAYGLLMSNPEVQNYLRQEMEVRGITDPEETEAFIQEKLGPTVQNAMAMYSGEDVSLDREANYEARAVYDENMRRTARTWDNANDDEESSVEGFSNIRMGDMRPHSQFATAADAYRGLTSIGVRIDSIREQLRRETDPAQRRALEDQLGATETEYQERWDMVAQSARAANISLQHPSEVVRPPAGLREARIRQLQDAAERNVVPQGATNVEQNYIRQYRNALGTFEEQLERINETENARPSETFRSLTFSGTTEDNRLRANVQRHVRVLGAGVSPEDVVDTRTGERIAGDFNSFRAGFSSSFDAQGVEVGPNGQLYAVGTAAYSPNPTSEEASERNQVRVPVRVRIPRTGAGDLEGSNANQIIGQALMASTGDALDPLTQAQRGLGRMIQNPELAQELRSLPIRGNHRSTLAGTPLRNETHEFSIRRVGRNQYMTYSRPLVNGRGNGSWGEANNRTPLSLEQTLGSIGL